MEKPHCRQHVGHSPFLYPHPTLYALLLQLPAILPPIPNKNRHVPTSLACTGTHCSLLSLPSLLLYSIYLVCYFLFFLPTTMHLHAACIFACHTPMAGTACRAWQALDRWWVTVDSSLVGTEGTEDNRDRGRKKICHFPHFPQHGHVLCVGRDSDLWAWQFSTRWLPPCPILPTLLLYLPPPGMPFSSPLLSFSWDTPPATLHNHTILGLHAALWCIITMPMSHFPSI